MQKIRNILWIAAIILLVFSFSVSALQYTENSEQSCTPEGICTTTLYSYQKYYQDKGQWQQIDENFGTENCQPGYQYCVDNNLYQAHFKSMYDSPLIVYKDAQLSFKLNNFASMALTTPSASVIDNALTYQNIAPGIDLRYTYLPAKLKEEIIIKDKSFVASLKGDLGLTFTLNSYGVPLVADEKSVTTNTFTMDTPLVYDNGVSDVKPSFTLQDTTLTMSIPLSWLMNASTVYPIVIDPSFGLNVSLATDVVIDKSSTLPVTYTRTITDRTLAAGVPCDPMPCPSNPHRIGMDWNLGSIPDNATITGLTLTLYQNNVAGGSNANVSVYHMDGNSSTYPDETTGNPCLGNCQYFADMKNGTRYVYRTELYNVGFFTFNLSNATQDFQQGLMKDSFSMGLAALETGTTVAINASKFSSSEASDVSKRPKLDIVYSQVGSTESEGDTSIEQGILNSLPTALIHAEQQVYTRSSSGTQQVGRFDRFAASGNKRWAFNYITPGESFTNMNNISTTLFVLELTDLFVTDITAQVSAFINATKS